MSSEEKLALAAIAISVVVKKRRRQSRREWVKQWLLKRPKQSHTTLLEELRLYPADFQNYLRMDHDIYNELLQLISPLIVKQDTNCRDAITPHERLAVTLTYLATGRSYADLVFQTPRRSHPITAVLFPPGHLNKLFALCLGLSRT
ncbi:hypothetical protein PoB_006356400 [Plakobranchus ocellatus]|uniref:Nuclease HARBI1 n=1 Tax=Plakobranchus ocellatus TaxID=259542 RepID=A0AAV4CYP5_9GAST|nr:hypothetical protein PoB_006356400 [Plakobranchus ocellatus]